MTTKTIETYIDHKSPYAYLAIAPAVGARARLRRGARMAALHPRYRGLSRQRRSRRRRRGDRREPVAAPMAAGEILLYGRAALRQSARPDPTRPAQDLGFFSLRDRHAVGQGSHGGVRAFNDLVYERFWRRELDIEDIAVVEAFSPRPASTPPASRTGRPRAAPCTTVSASEAEARGVFGVPTFVLDDELFWGREHLALIRLRLVELGLARAPMLETIH